jgi:manganese-dependent inorganic pyrophosphatase
MPMFEAKSDLWDMLVEDLIQYDYKIFEFGTKRVGIGSLETTNPSYWLGRKEEILGAFEWLKQSQNLDMIILCVVDILNEKNTTIVSNWTDSEHLSSIFWVTVTDNLADLWNRISRKKQIANEFVRYFS